MAQALVLRRAQQGAERGGDAASSGPGRGRGVVRWREAPGLFARRWPRRPDLIDLGTDDWRAIEIDEDGWRVIEDPPVRFRRPAGMRALPAPTRGGDISKLRRLVNVKDHADFVLLVCWLLAAMQNRGPYPVLAISGEQGTAKSTLVAILRALVDPNVSPLRALPREDRELFIQATNGWLLAFDNV